MRSPSIDGEKGKLEMSEELIRTAVLTLLDTGSNS